MTTMYADVPKYPDIVVQLSGEDGNAYMIIGNVASALRRGGVSTPEIDEFIVEAKSGDYDNVLQIAMRWVEVE
jgi:hypothetical protein